MNLALALGGLMVLIVIHEAGHMLAAKAVGMKVDRFALFFPPLILKRKIGETEYALGAIPLGGYVKIAGQNPADVLPPGEEGRAYSNQAIWRRAVMIAAGPAANLVTCLLLLMAVLMIEGQTEVTPTVAATQLTRPALGALQPGDQIVSIDGQTGGPQAFVMATRKHRCAGKQFNGCQAAQPAAVVIVRDSQTKTLLLRPRFDQKLGFARLGFSFGESSKSVGPVSAFGIGTDAMWRVTTATVGAITGLVDPVKREQLGSVVGGVAVTEQAFSVSLVRALQLLAFISLSLAIVNLFPLLPLDGGHLFWLLVEKLRGRPASPQTLERATVIGFGLVAVLFMIGLSNDIGRLASDGFRIQR